MSRYPATPSEDSLVKHFRKLLQEQRYKLIFHYMNGSTFTATRVLSYSKDSWDEIFYSRRKNKFTVEGVTIPLYDCIALEIIDMETKDISIQNNPTFDVVVDVNITTKRRKAKENNMLQFLLDGCDERVRDKVENEYSEHDSNSKIKLENIKSFLD